MSTKKALVVDDNLSFLKVIRRLFKKSGHTIITTDSAEEAEHILRYEEKISVIITDLRMPWLSGLDFCRKVKTLKPDLRVYALSGCVDDFDMNELKGAGFDGIYQKPINKAGLEEILNADI